MATTIVVTGATGKVGKLLVERLRRRAGISVRAAVRSPKKARELLGDVDLVEMDWTRPESVNAAMEGADRLFLVTPGGSDQVEQTWLAVQAAKAARLERIVKLGSLEPHRGPRIQVERWAAMTEDMVASSGIAYTFLRPSWFDQNFTEYMFAPGVKWGFIAAPVGRGRAGWVDCRDIASVAAVALTEPGHEGKAYTPTGPEAIDMHRIAAILSRAARRTIRYFDVPPGLHRAMGRAAGFPPRDVAAMTELVLKLRDDWLSDVTNDVERVTGEAPISFERFAEDNAHALRR